MKLSRSTGIGALCAVLIGSDAFAQSVYIDFGFGSTPSSSYAAAAGVPGQWNEIGILGVPTPLVGLQGAHTTLTVQPDFCDMNVDARFPYTSGDDDALLDDWFYGDCDAFNPSRIIVDGLQTGVYQLFVYPFAPGFDFFNVVSELTPQNEFGPLISIPPQPHFPGSFANWRFGVQTLHVTQPNSTLSIRFTSGDGTGVAGIQLLRLGDLAPASSSFCFGDGSSVACPCSNPGAPNRGCANIIDSRGARLVAAGNASVSADTLVLTATSMSGFQSWYFQGTGQESDPMGYGILCIGGALLRIGQKGLMGASSINPSGADLPLSIKGAIPPAGGTRHYQVSYRQANPPCVPSALTNTNRTNGVTIVWTP